MKFKIVIVAWLLVLTGWGMHLESRLAWNDEQDRQIARACAIQLDDEDGREP